MTRRDYYLIAGALKKCKSSPDHEYVVDMIATDLEKDNPAFKRELFLKESGVENVEQDS